MIKKRSGLKCFSGDALFRTDVDSDLQFLTNVDNGTNQPAV